MLPGMDKTTLLTEMREGHATWEAALAAIPDDALLRPAQGEWSRKDLVAHVEFWERQSAVVIEALREGRDPYGGGPPPTDDMNDRAWSESRYRSATDVRQGEAEAWHQLVALVEEAPEDELFSPDRYPLMGGQPVAGMVREDTIEHYAEHLPHLNGGGQPD